MEEKRTTAEKIQIVINTLKELDLKPTYENTNYMAGIYRLLIQARDEAHEKEEGKDAGEADAE